MKNLTAFETRYGTGKPIAGVWDPLKNLSNGGEQIKLSYGDGVTIHDFIYDDVAPWPPSADGTGSAMILLDPNSAPDHALGANWIGGPPTPGDGGEPEDPFGDWLAAQGASNPEAEIFPGMTYLMSYAIGGDLATDPHSVFPIAGYAEDVDGTHLTLSFRKRIDATQIDYLVETSTTFDNWQSGPGTIETVGLPANNGDGTETITVRVVATVTDNPVRFIRLRVSLNP